MQPFFLGFRSIITFDLFKVFFLFFFMINRYKDFYGGKNKETKMKLKDVTEDEEAGSGNQVLYPFYLFLSTVIYVMTPFLICETVHEI